MDGRSQGANAATYNKIGDVIANCNQKRVQAAAQLRI
jgi:predicted extracellular nuclease